MFAGWHGSGKERQTAAALKLLFAHTTSATTGSPLPVSHLIPLVLYIGCVHPRDTPRSRAPRVGCREHDRSQTSRYLRWCLCCCFCDGLSSGWARTKQQSPWMTPEETMTGIRPFLRHTVYMSSFQGGMPPQTLNRPGHTGLLGGNHRRTLPIDKQCRQIQ